LLPKVESYFSGCPFTCAGMAWPRFRMASDVISTSQATTHLARSLAKVRAL
jgi:hypothetical protein